MEKHYILLIIHSQCAYMMYISPLRVVNFVVAYRYGSLPLARPPINGVWPGACILHFDVCSFSGEDSPTNAVCTPRRCL